MIKAKHIKFTYILLISLLIQNCQLKKSVKNHGINYLENRYELLDVDKTNKNDVRKLIGQPHITSINNEDNWIYIERVFERGRIYKLGRDVLKENNVLVLEFNNRGILENKGFISKDGMNKVAFSENETANIKNKKSFVNKFLSSLKQKMYKKK
jgi:outer membrane protein assembly factor BamE (lipoprotein component of BamABCDE complex)|tara:strand:- start:1 stop:462 length:462 start_codon:yes stop_codon:yes gene_type:complete